MSLVGGLSNLQYSGSDAGGSVATGRDTHAGKVSKWMEMKLRRFPRSV